MAQANEEQKRVIDSEGGVLLSAGAGAGKTFVLVEHLVDRLRRIVEKHSGLGEQDLVQLALEQVRQTVVMTFTRKAAGELLLRLRKRLRVEKDESEECHAYFWDKISRKISEMTMTTIHGFCLKLLKGDYFSHIPDSLDLVSELEIFLKIDALFTDWVEHHLQESSLPKNLLSLFIENERRILSSFVKIFSDPSLRLEWRSSRRVGTDHNELNEVMREILRLEGLENWLHPFSFPTATENEDKKWLKYMTALEELKPYDFSCAQTWRVFAEIDASLPRTVGPRGKNADPVDCRNWELTKNVRDKVLRKMGESFLVFIENEDAINLWAQVMRDIFSYIEHNYFLQRGISFSDIEYLTLLGLEEEEACQKIQTDFSYLIVDEFQDTSEVQYRIIKKVLGGDLGRLVAVGDVKQAIYGFRGGELGVFFECERDIPHNLGLCNNYRSHREVVDFNNDLFKFLFPKSLGFEGVALHETPATPQCVPLEILREEMGKVVKLAANWDGEEKLSSEELNRAEAECIFSKIQTLSKENAGESIAVLYRKLAPAKFLIRKLLDAGIGFVAQSKISQQDDPILGMFTVLLADVMSHSQDDSFVFSNLMIPSYLSLLHLDSAAFDLASCRAFVTNAKLYGIFLAFEMFLESLHLANSGYRNNLKKIKELCLLGEDSFEKIYGLLDKGREEQYKFEFKQGERTVVQILTAHASKGLEFEHVFLGGISTNGAMRVDAPLVGDSLKSLRFKIELGQQDYYKTPMFFLEEKRATHKDFAESLRLFYVACTRAKKTLSYVDIQSVTKLNANSWINGLRQWEIERNPLLGWLTVETQDLAWENILNETQEKNVPLFHLSPVGITDKILDHQQNAVLSELSVTRLALLWQCPRKFYLKNICRFLPEELELFSSLLGTTYQEEEEEIKWSEDKVEEEDNFVNTADRGTLLHATVETWIKSEFLEEGELDPSVRDAFLYLKEELSTLVSRFHFISEKECKFPLGGITVVGIPDLVMIPLESTSSVEIWDFKTGLRREQKEKAYWFQLHAYAFAYFTLYGRKQTEQITLVLAYADESKTVKRSVSYREVIENLEESLSLLHKLDEKNRNSCAFCQFQPLC